MRRRGRARALRGVAAGALTTFLALVFHVLGGGVAPGPLAIAVCLFAVVWVSTLLGRARPSLPLLLLAVGASQVVLHTAFSLSTGSGAIEDAVRTGHAHDTLVVLGAHLGHAMWQAHLVAGVLTVVAVRRGERVLGRLRELAGVAAEALVRVAAALLALPGRDRAAGSSRVDPSIPAPLESFGIGTVVVRRGPPALAG